MNSKRAMGFAAAMILSLMVSLTISTKASAESYRLDPAHTSIIFRVKHLGVAYVFGRFNGATGSFSFDPLAPAKTAIEIQVDADNIDTNNQKRDNHLRSPDFFNTAKYPLIRFKSKSVKQIDTDRLQVSGDLTIMGKTNLISIEVRRTGAAKDPWGKFRIGFESSFTIKRSDYGMKFNLAGVSDEVNLTVSVEGIKQ